MISNAIPGFLKSSVLGSALFYAYDTFFESTKKNIRILTEIPNLIDSFNIHNILNYNNDKVLFNGKKNNDENDDKNINNNIEEMNSNDYIRDMAGNTLFVVGLSSFLVGSLGGSIHASLFLIWDAISQKIVNFGET